ncbi:aminotransferase [Elysia marginata]|uniref:Aminotransferase n=1 Tax=Elysia marginata TaxID=1093978 RepID=A0AAV4I3V3_9GAST|nr:aminotransferase [Elysia marginata]
MRALVPYADQAKRNGLRVYHLNIGQPDISSPSEVFETIKSIGIDLLPYSKSQGTDALRVAATEYYKKHDIEVSPDDIIVTTGASEGIFFLLHSITDIGDEIVTPEPFYANYFGFATISGVKIISVETKLDDNFSLPDVSSFEEKITDKTKAILICNPGNPTGNLYSKAEMEELGKLVVKYNLQLVVDEVYREFVYDCNERHSSVLQIKGLEDHAIMVDSVSKRYSLCGARVGFVVSKNKLLKDTILKFAQARLSPPTYGQIAAEVALKSSESYIKNSVLEYKSRRDLLVSELKKIPGIKVSVPKGAFYCMVALPLESAEDFAKWMLGAFQLDGETVMIAPAPGFYNNSNEGKNQVRIAYVLNKGDLKKSVQILAKGLEVYNSR